MATLTTSTGIPMAYDLAGSGPAVVLVHGITESRESWDPLVAPLAEGHTVVTIDLPGHGESGPAPSYDVPALAGAAAEVVAACGVDRPLLVGHSLGGVVVSAMATAVACRGVINVDQPLQLGAFKEGLAPLEPALRGDETSFKAAVGQIFESMAGPLSGAERARIESLRRPRQEVVLGIWAPVLDSPAEELEQLVREIGGNVTVPYLSLHGIDPGDGYGAWLADIIPQATVELWPDLGHYPHLIEPDRFLARLTTFDDTLT